MNRKKRIDLRTKAELLYQKAIEQAQPQHTLPAAFESFLPQLKQALEQSAGHNWHLFGLGKAAYDMALATLNIADLIQPPHETFILTDNSPSQIPPDIEVLLADHPIPTQRNIEATTQFVDRLKSIPKDEPIVMLISGGGSAMLCLPRDGIIIDDRQQTATHALMLAGYGIQAINTVRKHLSKVKGGQLAQLIKARPIYTLVISDVLGDDLSSIASGPLVGDETTFSDALKIIEACPLKQSIPKAVIDYLQAGVKGQHPETPTPNEDCFHQIYHKIIASNQQSVDAMGDQALKLGLTTQIISYSLCGEAKVEAQQFAKKVHRLSPGKTEQAFLAGGETTVKVTGSGKGGRNQEFALAFAIEMEKQQVDFPWVFLSAGTDGRDGPTDAAGAIVDHTTLKRGTDKGRDPMIDLNNNNSYAFLQATGDLIPSLSTGTNVADVQAFIAGNKE